MAHTLNTIRHVAESSYSFIQVSIPAAMAILIMITLITWQHIHPFMNVCDRIVISWCFDPQNLKFSSFH